MVQDWPRGVVPRQQSFYPQKYNVELLDQRRFYDAPDQLRAEHTRHQPPMAIETALRTHCGIWAKQYFVAVIMDDGTPTTFFSPGQKLEDSVVRQFFDTQKFQQIASQLDAGLAQPLGDPLGLDPTNPYVRPFGNKFPPSERRRMMGGDNNGETDTTVVRNSRKRPRTRQDFDDEDVAPAPAMPIVCRRGIKVSNDQALWDFYEQRFKNCQQSACKLIAKAWVKAVEPKKQSTHPYTGSDEKAPDWWPKPWGVRKEEKVRHKEPDHLYKRERVHLLNHILRLIVEPLSQKHPDVQKLNLTVGKLEDCTNEALSGFFAESPANASKKGFLAEIFKVARQQERYKNGEIDATVEVYVLNDDRMVDHTISENDELPFSRDEDDINISPILRSNGPQKLVPGLTGVQTPPNVAASNPNGAAFLNDVAVRPPQQVMSATMLHDMSGHHHPLLVDGGAPISIDMMSHPQDGSRRPSIYNEYSAVGNNTTTSIYTQHWQATATSPNPQTLYSHQQNPPPESYVSSVPVTHAQSYVGNSFVDPTARHSYDQAQLFRGGGGEAPQSAVNQPPQGYSYISSDGRAMSSLPGVSEVMEAGPRGHM